MVAEPFQPPFSPSILIRLDGGNQETFVATTVAIRAAIEPDEKFNVS